MNTAPGFTRSEGWRYGLLGLPLAFVALPLYVIVPNHYAREFGVPLAALGLVLLGTRLLDAVVDPLVGRWVDRRFARSPGAVLRFAAAACLLLAPAFALLLLPPVREPQAALTWAAALLTVTYLAFSAVTVAHQSWGAMLGGDEHQRSRIVGWREGLGLVGVLLASVAPTLWGLPATAVLFAVLLAAGWLAWRQGATPVPRSGAPRKAISLPLRRPAFRGLLAVFTLNGVASAIPATLVLFFVQDRLQASSALEPAFLATYFACAALAMPAWLALVPRWGLARTWLAGMGLAVAAFSGTLALGPGDSALFLVVCALSGAALGTDLALPGAVLAGTIAQAGDRGLHEGAYFGWWNFAAKASLALAAGLALPLLELAGYSPGTREPQALAALSMAYALLPCALKLLAGLGLYLLLLRPAAAAATRGAP
ncbi:MFS transporter [Ramlibacter rhizophilus]|uniref:MFS transporter n=1 Tax=Ramlibacter rhizophilus TaxID=1781167 RepID=A0A4Z0BHZ3_9BURK|nr:MFS transporter [Ramlibacter rhizophilus]TFY97887.1 MFS transporter [Ramlibacter rhizophilus]